jgi:hypothetical protein
MTVTISSKHSAEDIYKASISNNSLNGLEIDNKLSMALLFILPTIQYLIFINKTLAVMHIQLTSANYCSLK